jgi:hypothetical protein
MKRSKRKQIRIKSFQTNQGLSSQKHKPWHKLPAIVVIRKGMSEGQPLSRHFDQDSIGKKRQNPINPFGKKRKRKEKHESKGHTSLSRGVWHYMKGVLRFSALDNTSIGVLRRSGAWTAGPWPATTSATEGDEVPLALGEGA